MHGPFGCKMNSKYEMNIPFSCLQNIIKSHAFSMNLVKFSKQQYSKLNICASQNIIFDMSSAYYGFDLVLQLGGVCAFSD